MTVHDLKRNQIRIGSLKVETPNIGDHIQILACLNLLNEMNLVPSLFIDRDLELANEPHLQSHGDRLLLPLNGWFKLPAGNDPQWPPHERIIPLFTGFHIRPHVCPALLEERSLDYLRAHEPIGCRDPFTMDTLRARGVDAYLTNCLSLTFPKRSPHESGDSVIVASADQEILEIVPKHVREDHIFINHYRDTARFEDNLNDSQSLLDFYKHRAKLVITTFLHCALPCIAMGIPVVVFYPNRKDDFMKQSDRERFSGLRLIAPIHEFVDAPSVDWNPRPIESDAQKEFVRHDFRTRLEKLMRERQ